MSSPEIRPYTLSPTVADLVVADGVVRYRDERLRRRRVAICGSPGLRMMPWDDPTVECWAINNFWNVARDAHGRLAASRWWEQHQITPDVSGPHAGQPIQDANDMRWIDECPVPIYTTEPWPANPRAVAWPVDDYVRRGYRDYFACTFAMQIATAIDERFEEIVVCGLELLMGTKREMTVESSCVSYWLGLAEGRGIRVTLARKANGLWGDGFGRIASDEQLLLKHPYRYGHEYWLEADLVKHYVGRFDEVPAAV